MTRYRLSFKRLPCPTILGLIALLVVITVVQEFLGPDWTDTWGMTPQHVSQAWRQMRTGQFDDQTLSALLRIPTAMFLHGGLPHVISNSVFLWLFGVLLVEHLGRWPTLALFVSTGILGNVMQVVLEPALDVPVIGASGAVSGLEGTYFGLAFLWRLRWPDVWPLAHPIPPQQLAVFAGAGAAFDVYGAMQRGVGIAFGAHVGGFLSGLLIAGLITHFYPSLDAYRRRGL